MIKNFHKCGMLNFCCSYGVKLHSTFFVTSCIGKPYIVFTWQILRIFKLQTSITSNWLFQFKSDLDFKCVSHCGLHLGRTNFPNIPPLLGKNLLAPPKNSCFFFIAFLCSLRLLKTDSSCYGVLQYRKGPSTL